MTTEDCVQFNKYMLKASENDIKELAKRLSTTAPSDFKRRWWEQVNASGSDHKKTDAILIPLNSLFKEYKILAGHSTYMGAIAFSPDGKLLATGDADGIIIIWDTMSGGKIRMHDSPSNSILSVIFSPDGKFLVSGNSDRKIAKGNASPTFKCRYKHLGCKNRGENKNPT